jgi:hypothetical protein
MAPKVGPSGAGPKVITPMVAPVNSAGCFTTMANGGVAQQGIYKAQLEVDVETDNEEDPASTDVIVESATENGTKVCVSPTHCTWTFEDTEGRVHVGLSLVLPSSVGLNTAQLDAMVNDTGTVLRVHMHHPKTWGVQKYHKQACQFEGMSPAFIQYCLDGQKKELEKMVKLSKSKSREKILTFAEFDLPVLCEAEIVYTVPIHDKDSHVTTYIFVLRKQRTKDDLLLRMEVKSAHEFSCEDDLENGNDWNTSVKQCRLNYD